MFSDVDGVFGLRVGVDARVVKGALADVAVLVDQLPGGAGVVGDEQAAVFGFDHGVDAVGIGAGDRHADLADDALRASPGLRVISVQWSPPSVDLNRPLRGPPLGQVQGVR